jgi:hypothetical protein
VNDMATSNHPSRSRARPVPTRPAPRVDRAIRPPSINHQAAVVLLEMIKAAREQRTITDPPDDAA